MDISKLYGRLITNHQLSSDDIIQFNLKGENALLKQHQQIICSRCHFKDQLQNCQLPKGYYCRNCLELGRLTDQDQLYHLPEPNKFDVVEPILTWKGQLSPFQVQCSNHLRKHVEERSDHLIWAVTGAGKTEMLFPVLEENLRKKARIAIASPRIDVCNELFPRIQAAFHNTKCLLLHGGNSKDYYYAQLMICTTHQLMKFYHAFDVLIIDEMDSFPYVGNLSLAYGAKRARKPDGVTIYMTATPDEKTMKKIKQKRLTVDYLPLRFHQHPLPNVKFLVEHSLKKQITQEKMSNRLCQTILKWVAQKDTPFLIFVPKISLLEPLANMLHHFLPQDVMGTTVYAADPQRIEKVQALRDHQYRYLITTTILERGVTFKNLDLMVWDATDNNFTQSSLVQIAGRVGRSLERPNGDVYFVIDHYSRKVKGAANQIIQMNRRAQRILNE